MVVLKEVMRSIFGAQANSQQWRRMSVAGVKLKAVSSIICNIKSNPRNTATTPMCKIFISLLLVTLVGLATSQKYVRQVIYQAENCKGPEAWSIFTPTQCRLFNYTYRYSSCDPDGVRNFNCGSDSTCKSCTQTSIDKYGCGYVTASSCVDNIDFSEVYGPDAPVELYFTQQDCTGDPAGTLLYNTSAKHTQWASCSNDQFYMHNCTICGDDIAIKKEMACTYDQQRLYAIQRFCGWPGARTTSDATSSLFNFSILSVVAVSFLLK